MDHKNNEYIMEMHRHKYGVRSLIIAACIIAVVANVIFCVLEMI